jgi:hypothetical protein
MSLRCKPGDLAIVIASCYQENIGAIVRVLELHHDTKWRVRVAGPPLSAADAAGFLWRTDQLPSSCAVIVRDSSLQPIRGGEEQMHGSSAKRALASRT